MLLKVNNGANKVELNDLKLVAKNSIASNYVIQRLSKVSDDF